MFGFHVMLILYLSISLKRLKQLSLYLKLINKFQLSVCIGLCSRMVDHFLGSDNT